MGRSCLKKHDDDMNDNDNDNNKKWDEIFGTLTLRTSAELDARINAALKQALPQQTARVSGHGRYSLRRLTMSCWGKSTAAVILIAVAGILFVNRGATSALAITQALEAIGRIQSVHFLAEFYLQGKVECWMTFDGKNSKPAEICLFWPESPLRKIDGGQGTWLFNTVTNRKFHTQRDERDKDWYLDFAGFFRESLETAGRQDTMSIVQEWDETMKREVIRIHVVEKDRLCDYLLDPASKLPIQFRSSEPKNLQEWMRKTIAVRAMPMIEYDQPVPRELFTIPPTAVEVSDETDIIVGPDMGMSVPAGMTEQQAIEQLLAEVARAMNALDFDQVERLYFPFVRLPARVLEGIITQGKGKPLMELLEVKTANEKEGYWFVPVKLREMGNAEKEDVIRIKFFEFDGRRACMVARPD
jgi:hypothetical protein